LLSIIIYRDFGKRTKHNTFVLKLKAEKVSPSFSRKKRKSRLFSCGWIRWDGMGMMGINYAGELKTKPTARVPQFLFEKMFVRHICSKHLFDRFLNDRYLSDRHLLIDNEVFER
jgi:hypothetical protein